MDTSQFILQQNPNKISKEFLQLAKRSDSGEMVSTGPHTVKLLLDEEGERKNPRTNQMEKVIWFYVAENEVKKKYAVPIFDKSGNIHYLIQRLAELPEGTKVIMEYKKKPNSYEGYIDVQKVEEKIEKKTDSPLNEIKREKEALSEQLGRKNKPLYEENEEDKEDEDPDFPPF